MQPAHQFMTISDWEAPPAPARPPARLYLPGNECLYYISGYVPGPAPAPTAPAAPAGFRSAPRGAADHAAAGTTARHRATHPVLVPQYSQVDGGNTIPPDVVDPAYPLNIAPIEYVVRSVLSDDLLELQRADTAIDQLDHRRADAAERATLATAQADVAQPQKAIATIIARQRELTDSVEAAEHARCRADEEARAAAGAS